MFFECIFSVLNSIVLCCQLSTFSKPSRVSNKSSVLKLSYESDPAYTNFNDKIKKKPLITAEQYSTLSNIFIIFFKLSYDSIFTEQKGNTDQKKTTCNKISFDVYLLE